MLLVGGANLLVDGASMLAKKFGVPPLVVGLTIVAFGTSLPEFFVNLSSVLSGSTDIGLGNIVGSNLFNLLLILGLAAVITPLKVPRIAIWRETPFSFAAAAALLLLAGAGFDAADGIILLLMFAAFCVYTLRMAVDGRQARPQPVKKSSAILLAMIAAGLCMLFIGGNWVVEGAVTVSIALGLSEYVVSAIIVAAGTSLPELVTSLVAAMKKEMDIAVGNILGSNIFNILFVMGSTMLIAPIAVPVFLGADLLFLLIGTALLFAFMFSGRKNTLDRWEGLVLVGMYVLYLFVLLARG